MSLFQKVLSQVSDSSIEWMGFRQVREVTKTYYVRDGLPEANDRNDTHGVMVEVLVNGQFGYAATARLTEEGLHQAIQSAKTQALAASKYSVHKFTSAHRPKITTQYQSTSQKSLSSLSANDLLDEMVKISNKLKISDKIIKTGAFVRTVEMDMHFVSSNGSDASQKFSLITSDFDATAKNGNIVQTRTNSGLRGSSHQGGWEFFLKDDLWNRVNLVAEQAIELAFDSVECPSDTRDLILKPDQMMLQIHESIGHPLELDRILGDERNYAGWSFVNQKDFGKLQYGSPIMNVTFDPTPKTEFASYAFDDTGVPSTREYLIKDGLLVRGLGGVESQLRSKLDGVANMRASSWNRAPIDRMANINLEAGTSSFEDMLSGVQSGVMMESNRSWSIDDFRNKFQFGCEYGKLIENGKLTKTVRNPNYRGITVPFWTNLKKVGNAATMGEYGTPYCGKGEPNQIIRVGHTSPICLFENIEVFGGAE
jgi:predicted Zn-dependent protease